MSALLDREQRVVESPLDGGDSDLVAHYVNKNDQMEAIFNGTPITALCGKTWLPTRDGTKFPTCSECYEIWLSYF